LRSKGSRLKRKSEGRRYSRRREIKLSSKDYWMNRRRLKRERRKRYKGRSKERETERMIKGILSKRPNALRCSHYLSLCSSSCFCTFCSITWPNKDNHLNNSFRTSEEMEVTFEMIKDF